MWRDWKQLHRKGPRVRAEDEMAVVEIQESEEKGGTTTHSVECRALGAVWDQRRVVAIEDCDCAHRKHRIHCGSLLSVGAHRDEALPLGVTCRWPGPIVVQPRG